MDRRSEILQCVTTHLAALKWIKLVGVGSQGVGKTSLIKYFCENKFSPVYQPTIGVDYGFKQQTIGKQEVRTHLWDLSGSDEYIEVRNELYEKTDGLLLVFDVTNAASLTALDSWLDEVTKLIGVLPCCLVCACKVDLKQKRVVTKDDGEEWARKHNMGYYEASSASGEGVHQMFSALITKCLSSR